MPAVHDRGGWPTNELIDRTEHEHAYWEKSTHALLGALGEKHIVCGDELRRGIESLPLDQYETLSYYEKWSASLETLLVEKNILSLEEIEAKVKEMDAR